MIEHYNERNELIRIEYNGVEMIKTHGKSAMWLVVYQIHIDYLTHNQIVCKQPYEIEAWNRTDAWIKKGDIDGNGKNGRNLSNYL